MLCGLYPQVASVASGKCKLCKRLTRYIRRRGRGEIDAQGCGAIANGLRFAHLRQLDFNRPKRLLEFDRLAVQTLNAMSRPRAGTADQDQAEAQYREDQQYQ